MLPANLPIPARFQTAYGFPSEILLSLAPTSVRFALMQVRATFGDSCRSRTNAYPFQFFSSIVHRLVQKLSDDYISLFSIHLPVQVCFALRSKFPVVRDCPVRGHYSNMPVEWPESGKTIGRTAVAERSHNSAILVLVNQDANLSTTTRTSLKR